MNEVFFIITILLSFSGVLLFYKLFGKNGLFVWIAIATIVSNIQTVKLVNIFGLETALGTVLYGSTFLATDILNEVYGKKNAKKSILYGFSSMVMMTIFMYISLLYMPSQNDFTNESLSLIFNLNIRITVASITGFCTSQFLDTTIYNKLKEKTKLLWVRNNTSTMISQLFDTIIFVLITYIGTIPFKSILEIILTMYIFKFIVAIMDTPFMYISKKIRLKEEK